jgi:hypothetical protein
VCVHGPAEYSSAMNIEYGNEVEPALAGEHRGRVGDPNLIESLHR